MSEGLTLIQQPYLSKTFHVCWLPARLLCSWRPAQRREGGGEEGEGGGKRGGEGQDGTGGGGAGSTGITGSRLEQQQTASGVGGHRAAAHGSRSWGTWGEQGERGRWCEREKAFIRLTHTELEKKTCCMTQHIMWSLLSLSEEATIEAESPSLRHRFLKQTQDLNMKTLTIYSNSKTRSYPLVCFFFLLIRPTKLERKRCTSVFNVLRAPWIKATKVWGFKCWFCCGVFVRFQSTLRQQFCSVHSCQIVTTFKPL